VIVFARQFLFEGWQVVLGVGILDMSDKFTASSGNVIHEICDKVNKGGRSAESNSAGYL